MADRQDKTIFDLAANVKDELHLCMLSLLTHIDEVGFILLEIGKHIDEVGFVLLEIGKE